MDSALLANLLFGGIALVGMLLALWVSGAFNRFKSKPEPLPVPANSAEVQLLMTAVIDLTQMAQIHRNPSNENVFLVLETSLADMQRFVQEMDQRRTFVVLDWLNWVCHHKLVITRLQEGEKINWSLLQMLKGNHDY